ncbi:type VI secretion system accessory protein TagJ [Falsiroseomonas selenitidurans]|uniref:Tetratricopeptide repeat protein n=1 Tax=Falsiroseomonas selenitidurans TaxID=2716335 RepID=A0ABX1EBA5_9PROT|nr:type VI secretion system accessory protein TagJ [Falsiroseomonas selenitidurans]NKC34101.1 tetratricopeptide repeat protein [Falsiroseomonas selenitidurans]
MTTAGEAFHAGDLPGALAAATAAVKAAPADSDARWLLAELMLYAGEAERADRMLDAAALREPNPAVLEFRKLLRAEVVRGQVLGEGRAPKYQGDDATPAQQAALRARVLLRAGELEAAQAAAEAIEALRPRAPGTADDTPFDDLRDADDLFAAEFEVLTTAGDHLLVPVERVRSLTFDPPRRPRDLFWRRCAIELKDGTEGVVFMPALYPGAAQEADAQLRLGRATEWTHPEDGPVRGRGQRLLLAGDDALAIASVTSLVFE